MPHTKCAFCNSPKLSIVAENALAFAIRDTSPARPLHTLIIPKRHVVDIFETSADEREAMHELAMQCRQNICDEDPRVGGFNFGSNVGVAAGQKIFHAHVHLIPRRQGDTYLQPASPD
jgi:diadenosine tetraphosphate (Ap4A) HIT family hydrolase